VAVRNGYGFIPCHGDSQYQDQPLWQEENEKRREMARLQISSNDQKGLTQAKPGGATHSSRRTVTKKYAKESTKKQLLVDLPIAGHQKRLCLTCAVPKELE
ncbi:MAG: hypothetical protein WBG50_00040, partial [Desulfomonilaceae bacterium]